MKGENMVGISDGNNDGRFKIQKGQGLSQAIASELGLNAQQCKKLGSVWNEIFKEVDKQNQQTQIYTGGNDLHGATNQNYVVHTNQVIEFSKEIWNKIIQLVNAKLGTNLKATEGSAPPAANEPPEAANTESPERPSAASPNNSPAKNNTPAPVKVSTEGIAAKIPNTPYLAETPDMSAAVKQLKGETQSNWAVSSKMKSALNTVNKENVAYFVEQYNKDGSDLVTDIDDCVGWNKKDIYETLTKKLIARAKELGIDISGYDVTPKTTKSTRAVGTAGATQEFTTTEYPSLQAQRKFLNEISEKIRNDESLWGSDVKLLQTYKPQIEKANATIKKFAEAPTENIKLQEKNKYGEYTLSLNDKSALSIKVDENNKIISLQIMNSTSPDRIGDFRYNFAEKHISLDADEKYNGPDDVIKSGYLPDYIPFDKLKEVATNLLKKMGVEIAE